MSQDTIVVHPQTTVSEGLDRQEMAMSDMLDQRAPAFNTYEVEPDHATLEVHHHAHPHDHAHVDLMKDEYTPDEVASMLGTSLEVIMHAIWRGELKAERQGHQIVCIPRAALLAWYKIGS